MSVATLAVRILSSALSAGLILLAAGSAGAQEGRNCTLSRLSGPATLQRDGTVVAVATGTKLSDRDRLRTGADAKAEVTCDDGAVVTLGAATDLDLGRIAGAGNAGSLLGLLEGIARFMLPENRKPGAFEVTAPTAVASVRSTEWLMQVDPRGTAVFVVRGRVGVQGRAAGPIADLNPGQGVDVPPATAASSPRAWSAERVATALRAVTF